MNLPHSWQAYNPVCHFWLEKSRFESRSTGRMAAVYVAAGPTYFARFSAELLMQRRYSQWQVVLVKNQDRIRLDNTEREDSLFARHGATVSYLSFIRFRVENEQFENAFSNN